MVNHISQMFHICRRGLLIRLLAALSVAVLLPSCINDSADCPDAGETEGPFQISFRIVTRTAGGGSRAADITGDEVGFAYENFIDVNDIRFILFDGSRNMIADVTPQAEIRALNESFTIYEVRAKLDQPYFVDRVNGNVTGPINFYVLVLANYAGWEINLPPLQEGVAMADLFADDRPLTALPSTAALMKATTGETDSQLFPMAGLQYFSINANNLLNTTEDQPFDLSNQNLGGKTIYMLRSLAKIEIIDRINVPEETGYVFNDNGKDADSPLRIEKAEMDGYFNQGLLLPALAQWQRNVTTPETQQVIGASIPTTATYQRPPALSADNTYADGADFSTCRLDFAYDAAATAAREDKCPVYSCYVFEYSNAGLTGNTQRPYFRVTTKGSNSPTQPYESMILPFRMFYTTDGDTIAERPELLRNYIYRYEITGISQQIEFNWTVCPMDNATANITFN